MSAQVSSSSAEPQTSSTVAYQIPTFFETLYLWAWSFIPSRKYKDEQCEICETYFRLHTGLGIAEPSPNPDVSKPEQQARCHGCAIANFAISFFGHTLHKKKNFTSIRESRFSIEPDLGHTHFLIEGRNKEDTRRISASLELLKTTKPHDDSWLGWAFSFWGPGPREKIPPYIEYAYETTPISGFTGSQTAFDTIHSWFRQCVLEHAACSKNTELPLLPTRVIDISDKDGVKLIESNGSRGNYFAISHRWGDLATMPRCLHENIDDLKKNVPWNWLTQTFRDAIVFARSFSNWYIKEFPGSEPISYIWIDSLCIIQNSAEDWAKESAQMCAVYEGAILTIAGASGPDGCFSTAQETYKGFEMTNPQRPNPRLFLREELPGHGDLIEKAMAEGSNFTATFLDLLTRGWVFQERLLSRRFVLFTPNEIIWECLETSNCECGKLKSQELVPQPKKGDRSTYAFKQTMHNYYESHRQEDPSYPMSPRGIKTAYHMSLSDIGTNRERNLRNWWRRLINIYSALKLTKESDRLPAMAGLATHFKRSTGKSEYIAGNFGDGLPLDLGWNTDAPVKADQKQGQNIPSWSWASCGSRVEMLREEPNDMVIFPEALSVLQPDAKVANSSDSVKMRCILLTGLDESKVKDQGLDTKYFPDTVVSQAAPFQQGIYIPVVGYPSQTAWLLIHVQPVQGSSSRFSRLGRLDIYRRITGSYDKRISDDIMHSWFESKLDCDIELV